MQTHEVFNQVPSLEGTNFFEIDSFLQEMVRQNELDWGKELIQEYGAKIGQAAWMEKGFQVNQQSPVFHSHDRYGNRIDAVEYHPAYHELMALAIENRVHSLPWTAKRKGAHLVRLSLNYLHTQNESGTGCPLTMTFAAVPSIANHFAHAKEWLPKITSNQYNPADVPYFEKEGVTIGMAMTEKQGGTDVRANTTKANPVGASGNGEIYELTGHKWFCSAPMCDAFLTLAQTEKGLSCFLLPRWRPDGTKNNFRIQRLKDKLGNRSNASSEVEFEQTFAWLIGEEGRGVPTIIEMVGMTRYDCMIGSSGLMRRGLTEAIHHTTHRSVMGKKLIDQPLMQNVLVDLALEVEGALALTYRTAMCLENGGEVEQSLLRLLMPIGKYWITKRATFFLAEAMECLGGNGYVEQSILPRLFREAPVNAIWEGSGNVQCLDVIRAIKRTPHLLESCLQELESAQGNNAIFDQYLTAIKKKVVPEIENPYFARQSTETLAKGLQAAQLIKLGNAPLADAFCEARLSNSGGLLFGNLSAKVDCGALLKRYIFA